jgi:hypothetical protein
MFGDNKETKQSTPEQLLHPASQAVVNEQTNNIVREAVAEALKGAFAALAPIMQGMQLTPEKLNELKKPFIDPKFIARELRETVNTKKQEAEQRAATAARQAGCPHLDLNQRDSICLIHNFHDHQARGICVLCHDLIHPREWRIGAPDPITAESKPYVVEQHKDYARVRRLESLQS